ncbi:MAG: hypothetical protein IKJ63_01175, partial [Clostridia bacterium]|nr:hypothetical protein [Clostridia bacterium]
LCRKKAQERSKTIEYCFAWKTLAGGFPLRDSATIAKSAQTSINILYYRLPVYKFTFKQHFVCHGASHLRKPPARVFLTTFLRFLKHKEFRPLRRATKGSASRHRKLLKKFDQNFLMTDERHKLTRQTVI